MYGLSAGAVNQLLRPTALADLRWPLRADLHAKGLLERLYGPLSGKSRVALDLLAMHKQLSRRTSLTSRRRQQTAKTAVGTGLNRAR